MKTKMKVKGVLPSEENYFGRSWFDASQAAILLNIKGFGRTKLYKFLREQGLLDEFNQPTNEYLQNHYLSQRIEIVEDKSGQVWLYFKVVLFSLEGLAFIQQLLNKQNENE